MEAKQMVCNSCKTKIANMKGSVQFKCPSCGKGEILRCPHCRKVGTRYACGLCSFTGPN
ncbi:RNA-binding protein [Candidatus Woesearchaeota archaeon]|nr:RNA-binding protein [Candidatus Woesearchaeota archaeon]